MMWFSICIFAVSLLIGSLWSVSGRYKPWQSHRGQKHAGLLAQLHAFSEAWRLLWALFGLLFIMVATLYLSEEQSLAPVFGEVIALVVILWLLGNSQFVQRMVVQLIEICQKKWGNKLSFIVKALNVVQGVAARVFTEQPLYQSEQELHTMLAYQQRKHAAIPESRHKQLSCLMEVQNTSVASLITPVADAELLKASDLVGPLLLAQLHESQYAVFAVRGKTKSNIVGIFSLDAAVRQLEREVTVEKMMTEQVVFVAESATILQAIQEFTEMNVSLLVVLDEQNKAVGVLYLQDVLRFLFAPK